MCPVPAPSPLVEAVVVPLVVVVLALHPVVVAVSHPVVLPEAVDSLLEEADSVAEVAALHHVDRHGAASEARGEPCDAFQHETPATPPQ